ncbi:copper chaperone PCu(A)C [Neisseriaceae bacterium TC5R-5]|nr:copper chaperone PCu(A)C [Neisseriaceae bacterium TC5R-5]
MMKYLLALLLSLGTISLASAQSYKLRGLEIDHPWSRAMPTSSPTGAVYLKLSNKGKVDDKLIAASTPRAQSAELHSHLHDNGVMRMREVTGGVSIAAGKEVGFEPGGYHIMLIGLKQALTVGDRFPLTLKFAKAGAITVEVIVQKDEPGHNH